MAKDELSEEFLEGIKEAENILLLLHFYPYSFEEKGAYFFKYKKRDTIVEFFFGPSDWDVEMIIFTVKGKFAFKDLLQIPAIAKWVQDNRYAHQNGRNIKYEILWFIELLKFSLPLIE